MEFEFPLWDRNEYSIWDHWWDKSKITCRLLHLGTWAPGHLLPKVFSLSAFH